MDGKTQGQTYGMDIINLQPAHIDDLDKDLLDWVTNDDNLSDRHIRQLLRTEQFNFDWSHDHMKFTGRKETFTGQSGPTFELTDDTKPIDIFCKFFDDEIWDLLTRQTNKYAKVQKLKTTALNSRLKCWKDVDKNEMAIVLAILILQGLVSLPCETNYWRENGYLTLKYFKDLMTYNRFLLIMRLLHFSDVTDTTALRLTKDERKLRKIKPVLDFLNKKFSALYLPGQNIGIGESLLKWKGPLSFAQKIATKAAQVGVKSYELCESTTGYLWSFFVYTGKVRFKIDDDSNIDRQTNPKDTQTETPTDRAADRPSDRPTGGPTDRQTDRPTDGSTDTPTDRSTDRLNDRPMDRPTHLPAITTSQIVHKLAEPLFHRGHTLVMDNFYNSPLLARYLKSKGTDCFGTLRINRKFVPEALKSVSKMEMRTGELIQNFTNDLNVMMWRDTNVVSMLSTFHKGIVRGKEKIGYHNYKPEIVLDYNLSMGGVDKKDQLLLAFPMERTRNQGWYKKVFRRLLNCTILNAYIIYKTHNPHATQRWFRNQLAEELIKTFKPPAVQRPLDVVTVSMAKGEKKARPILTGNHFIGIGTSKYLRCVWCKKSRTKYICKQCDVALCLEICFEHYHTVPDSHHT